MATLWAENVVPARQYHLCVGFVHDPNVTDYPWHMRMLCCDRLPVPDGYTKNLDEVTCPDCLIKIEAGLHRVGRLRRYHYKKILAALGHGLLAAVAFAWLWFAFGFVLRGK